MNFLIAKFKACNKLLLAVSIFYILFLNCCLISGWKQDFSTEQKYIFAAAKIISIPLIIFLFQAAGIFLKKLKEKNEKALFYAKYTLFYFLINVFVFFLLYPVQEGHYDISYAYDLIKNYEFNPFINITSNLVHLTFYHIIPSLQGIILSSLFLFSIIFSYCIYGVKQYISSKYYKIAAIPFLIPAFLVYNGIPRRHIYAAWCFLFMFLFLLFNKNKKIGNIAAAVFFGILTAYFMNVRAEFLILIVIYPLIVFLYKIFSKKCFILYLVIFFSSYFLLSSIQNHFHNMTRYKNDNYIMAYTLLHNDGRAALAEKDKKMLKEVFPEIDNFSLDTDKSEKEIKQAQQVLERMIAQNAFYILKRNINLYEGSRSSMDFHFLKFSSSPEYFQGAQIFRNELNKHPRKEKILSYFIYGTDNYFVSDIHKTYYSIKLNLVLLLVMLFGGLASKKRFYCIFSCAAMLILIPAAVFAVSLSVIYYYISFFNIQVMFFIFLADLLGKKKNE